MLVKTKTGTVVGVEGLVIHVEVDMEGGVNAFRMVGLPDAVVREAQVRVRSALFNSGFGKLKGAVTVNLAPADVKKQGSAFDLAVALGLVAAKKRAPVEPLLNTLFLGELALDGNLRSVRGVLPAVLQAAKCGLPRVVVPKANGAEAALVKEVSVYTVDSLREAVDLVSSDWVAPEPITRPNGTRSADDVDLSDVKGQRAAKRALEIAAAGGHNLLMSGPPGAGKSLLAMRLPSLLPPLSFEHALEVTKIYSVAGLLDDGGLVSNPPFRAPHHTVSTAAMVGGGIGPRPGEVSLAHRGVLFLDELAEFVRPSLESLRQPLEEGKVRIRRVDRMATLPARFTLVAAMNPCPCGYRGAKTRPCDCTPGMIHRYQSKISGPLLDRIDLRIGVRALASHEMLDKKSGESSADVRGRVERARRVQGARFRRGATKLNAFMTPKQIARYCGLDGNTEATLKRATEQFLLSARAFHRVLKVARTIADLAGADAIESTHLQEAIIYRASSNRDEVDW
ncbi:MAG: YifB family Mg chelatase-like AAA ATPase [Acidobacteriota bacterium]|nr:MAG: YifB family Mg chelatase-like AAA ATPase [Acidobacteriota bacterium]